MKFIRLLAVIATAAMLTNCSKSSTSNPPTPTPTSLEITVRDENGALASATTVRLFTSSADWLSASNSVSAAYTNTNGVAKFTGLTNRKYYWLAEKGCRTNHFNTSETTNAIPLNVTSTVSTTISPSGTIMFKNNSSNPYAIYLNGALTISSMAGNSTMPYYYVPAGLYSIRVLQLSGYAVYPTDKTYTGTVVCGGTLNVSFP